MIYLRCDGTKPTINQLVGMMNTIHPTIKFTLEKDPNKITFLVVNRYNGQTSKLLTAFHLKHTWNQRINNYIYMQDPIILQAQRKE